MNTPLVSIPARLATALALVLAPAAMAQDAAAPDTPASETAQPVPAPESGAAGLQDAVGTVANNPHEMLDQLSGGPLGSPTATRGNPLPGTSTSIPTTNPATVFPLGNPSGAGKWVEDTGLEGKCDPSQSFEKCPERPATKPSAEIGEQQPMTGADGEAAKAGQ